MSLAVAKQYALALYDALAPMDSARAQAVITELESFQNLLEESQELRAVLLNPSVTIAQKKSLVDRLSGQLGVALSKNFLLVVIGRRRIGIFDEIREAFEELVSDRAGVTRAQITAAAELNPEQRQRIERELATLTASSVRCRYDSDESLLGGAVVQIGSTVYDGSIRGQLEALRQRLTE